MRKKIILLSTLVSIIFTSCDKEPYITQNTEKAPIVLATEWSSAEVVNMSQKKTRATELTNSNIVDFGVYAYYDEDGSFDNATSTPNFLDNAKATNVSG